VGRALGPPRAAPPPGALPPPPPRAPPPTPTPPRAAERLRRRHNSRSVPTAFLAVPAGLPRRLRERCRTRTSPPHPALARTHRSDGGLAYRCGTGKAKPDRGRCLQPIDEPGYFGLVRSG